VYQLQDIDPSTVGESLFDIAVVDYSTDGSDDEAFSTNDVSTMRGDGSARKLVLAYMSIGEAEDYRFYFDGNAAYVDEENPEWPGNYKVFYWESAWQTIIDSYIDRLIDAGFDGAYLDIIDAYEYYGPGGDSGLERALAADDMIDFVVHIAEYARAQNPDFLIFPQNGAGIINDGSNATNYFTAINGIGAEDSFYFGDDDEDNALNEQSQTIEALDEFVANGKTVLSIEYLTDDDKVDDYYSRAATHSYLPYATVRFLNEFTVSNGHEPE
jgi:cysteinyl-tRNA synthetase